MKFWTHLHGGPTIVDGLPLQPDFVAIRSETGPVPDDGGMLKKQQIYS